MAVTFLRADILAKLCRCFYIQFQIGISHLKHPNCNAVNNKLLLFYGDTFYVEKMNYKALQKRSAETEIDAKTGKIYSKKRFGKSLGRCAPAMFISMLTQKAERYNGKVIKVDTFKQRRHNLIIRTTASRRKSSHSVLQSFPMELSFSETCIPHSCLHIWTINTKHTIRLQSAAIFLTLLKCTTKQKNTCRTAMTGCLQA